MYLAECLETAHRHIGVWDAALEVVLGGGVFQSSPVLIDLIKQNVTIPVNCILATAPPVFGAVWEAVRESTETVTKLQFDMFRAAFLSSCELLSGDEDQ